MLILKKREMMMSLSIADNNDTDAFLQDQEKIDPFQRFFNKIVSGSYPILLAVILAMIWANLLQYYRTSEGQKSGWGISLIREFE